MFNGEFFKLLGFLAKKLQKIAERFPIATLATIVFVVAIPVLNDQVNRITERHITVLVGPKSGNAERRVQAIQEYHKQHPGQTYWSRRYVLEPVTTDGFEENRKRIDADRSGNVIGFAHDGFSQPNNVRSMLPLTVSLLHIFAHKKLLDHQLATNDGTPRLEEKTSFKDLVTVLKSPEAKGKVYLGPQDSGTRQLALVVLEYYGLNPGTLEATGTSAWGWGDMSKELIAGHILLGFSAIPPEPNTFVSQIAKSGECRLIGLDDVKGICTGRQYILQRAIAKGAYSGSTDFSQNEVETLATKNLLICSSAMDETDAYFLASLAREGLRAEIPEVDWMRSRVEKTTPEELTFMLHPGAELLRDEKTPSWISTFDRLWLIAFVPFLLALSSALIKQANMWIEKREANEKSGDDASQDHETGSLQLGAEEIGHAVLDQELPAEVREKAMSAALSGFENAKNADHDRMAFLDILSRLGHTDEIALSAISKVASEEGEPRDLRLECIERLGEIGRADKHVAAMLRRLQKSGDLAISAAASRSLQEIKLKRSVAQV